MPEEKPDIKPSPAVSKVESYVRTARLQLVGTYNRFSVSTLYCTCNVISFGDVCFPLVILVSSEKFINKQIFFVMKYFTRTVFPTRKSQYASI